MPSGTFGAAATAGLGPNFISFTGASAYASITTSTTLTINAPAGVATNVLVVAVLLWFGSATITLPDGTWHNLFAKQNLIGGSTSWFQAFYRVATGVDTNYIFTIGASSTITGYTLGFSGENTSTPIDANTGFSTVVNTPLTATSSQIYGPSTVPATDNATPITFAVAQAASNPSLTAPGSLFLNNDAVLAVSHAAFMGAPVRLNQATASKAFGVGTGSGARAGNPVWCVAEAFIEHP